MTRNIVLGAAALGLVSFALPACAQEYAAPIPFRILSDPAYLPMQDQWSGSTAFDWAERSANEFDSTGAQTFSRHAWQDAIVQELEYGVTDDLAVRIQDTYVAFDKRKDDFTAGGFTDHSETGFQDPQIGVTWRAWDQVDRPVNVDLLADYRMNVIQAQTNNVAEGGQSGDVGLAVSKVMPGFTIYGKMLADWYGTQSELDPLTPSFVRESSYWDYSLDLDTQTRLTELLSFNAGIGYVFANNAMVRNLTASVNHISEPGNGLSLNAALNYAVQPNVVVSLTYAYNHADTDKELYATPASDTFLRNHAANTVGVKFAYDTP
jgi:opacity protein-like surface antigen